METWSVGLFEHERSNISNSSSNSPSHQVWLILHYRTIGCRSIQLNELKTPIRNRVPRQFCCDVQLFMAWFVQTATGRPCLWVTSKLRGKIMDLYIYIIYIYYIYYILYIYIIYIYYIYILYIYYIYMDFSGFQADFYFYTVSMRTVFKGSSTLFKGSSSKIQSKKLCDPSRLREAADIMCSSLGAFTSGGTFGFDWKWPGNLQSYPIVNLRNQRSLDLKRLQKL